MKRIPLIPTLLVAVAVAAMIAMGVWQLHRRELKQAMIARYAANRDLPAIALPRFPDEGALYRRASAMCLQPVGWHADAGRAADGSTGWRLIADCRTGAEGPGFAVQLGIAPASDTRPAWRGGVVRGIVVHAPQHRSLIEGLWHRDQAPRGLMIVADTPPVGLKANAAPDPADLPNNHLAYAVQWFAFAGVAAAIYAVALRRRMRATPIPPR